MFPSLQALLHLEHRAPSIIAEAVVVVVVVVEVGDETDVVVVMWHQMVVEWNKDEKLVMEKAY